MQLRTDYLCSYLMLARIGIKKICCHSMMPFLVHKDDRVLKLVHMCSLLPPFSGIHSERETLSSNIKSITATFSLPPFSLSLSSPLSLHLSSRRVLPLGRFIFILGSDELEQT